VTNEVIIPDFLTYSDDEGVGFSQFGTLQTDYKVAHPSIQQSSYLPTREPKLGIYVTISALLFVLWKLSMIIEEDKRRQCVWKKGKSEINKRGKKSTRNLLLTVSAVFSTIGQYDETCYTYVRTQRYVTRTASRLHTSTFTASKVVQLAHTTAADNPQTWSTLFTA
jgi:hypothetical protein